MSLLKDVIGYGTHAGRPAAGSEGRLYYETDTATIFRDSGTSWLPLSVGSGAPSLVKLGDTYLDTVPASTFHFTAIDPSYNALRLVIRATSTDADDSTGNTVSIFFNGDTTSSNYGNSEVFSYAGSSLGAFAQFNSTGAYIVGLAGSSNAQPLLQDTAVVDLPGYADTNIKKIGLYHSASHHTSDHSVEIGKIHWLNTSAIDEILVTIARGQFAQWSRATLYGVV